MLLIHNFNLFDKIHSLHKAGLIVVFDLLNFAPH